MSIKKFLIGSTVLIIAEVYNLDGDLADSDSVTCTITDPSGTAALDAAAMTKTATGTYLTFFTPDTFTTGVWTVRVKTTDLDGETEIYSQDETTFSY